MERFYKVRSHPLVSERYQLEHLGKPKSGMDIYERNNSWTFYSSLLSGIDRVRLITFWDGKSGTDQDALLVKHMLDLMRDRGTDQSEQDNADRPTVRGCPQAEKEE